jgi:ArsR family transcriptional regulator, arsenate/arsenite/antimonite-responsive transcriptional repressor / arsenate reductase (thioredoxin)
MAAALWNVHSKIPAESAGVDPAVRVHPLAVRAAARHGLDLRKSRPRSYAQVKRRPDLVISVCDRGRESVPPFEARLLHWSIPDPVEARKGSAFDDAFIEIAKRVEMLAPAVHRSHQSDGRS